MGISMLVGSTERRLRRAYIYLRSLCTTDEARASLDKFKTIMEAREQKMVGGPQGKVVKEKQGWLESSSIIHLTRTSEDL